MHEAEAWVEGMVKELKATGEVMRPVYVNFMGKDERAEEAFGDQENGVWKRLRKLKGRVDREDLFAFAQPGIR